MNDVIQFEFEGDPIRSVVIGGEPYIVGIDLCQRLGYSDPASAMKQHCRGAVKRHPLQTPGGMQEIRVLPENDVMRLIIRSKLPAAERFERWVFDDVLPSIRKTGSYGVNRDPMAVLNDPAAMRVLLLGYTEKVLALESRVTKLAPKALALDRIATASGSLNVTDAAKALQIQPHKLIAWLQANLWAYRRSGGKKALIGYQDKVQQLLVEHKVSTYSRADGEDHISEQLRITPKGLAKLAEAFSAKLPGLEAT